MIDFDVTVKIWIICDRKKKEGRKGRRKEEGKKKQRKRKREKKGGRERRKGEKLSLPSMPWYFTSFTA